MSERGPAPDFTAFVTANSVGLLRTAYLLSGDRALAEDLVQTALAKAFVSWGRIRDPGAAEAYVRRTLVRTASSWWRRKSARNERPVGDALPDRGVSARFDDVDERERIWAVVRALPARQRAVIVLRFYEDLTEKDTAAALGCAVGTVKAQTHRALARLRKELGDPSTVILGEDA